MILAISIYLLFLYKHINKSMNKKEKITFSVVIKAFKSFCFTHNKVLMYVDTLANGRVIFIFLLGSLNLSLF